MSLFPHYYSKEAVHDVSRALLTAIVFFSRRRERPVQILADEFLRQAFDDMDNSKDRYLSEKDDFDDLKDYVFQSWNDLNSCS